MEYRLALLTARVEAVNAANRTAIELHPHFVEIFRPFVGQKILKADGNLLQKVQAVLPNLIHKKPINRVIRGPSSYSLNWTVTASVTGETSGHSIYSDATFYVGELSNGVLTKLCDPPELRTDYTVERITELRENYKEAQRLATIAKVALGIFGENDR